MILLIAAAGALGLALLVTGLPPMWRIGLTERVEPYLNGLGGRPVRRLPSAHPGAGPGLQRLQATIAPLLPDAGPLLVNRLTVSGTGMTVGTFRFEQLMWATGGACSSACVAVLMSGSGAVSILVAGILGGASGAVARERWLSKQIAQRRERVRQEMPVALDLLTLAILAGESVPAAFARVASLLDGEVGRALRHVVGSMRAGTSVPAAIEEFATLLPHPSAARLADCLAVAMERGAPLAETLRAQADDLREGRRRDLLEMGGRKEIAMLVPIIFLILPTIVAFVLLPGLVSLDLVVP